MVVVRRPWVSYGEIWATWGGFGWPMKAMGELWGMRAACGWGVHGWTMWALWVHEREVRAACCGVVDICELWGRCGLHVVAMVAMGCMWTTYGLCVLWGRCRLHVVSMVAIACMWTTYGLRVSYEGGVGWMWWPWDTWRLHMGCVCVVREVQASCGGNGVMGCKRAMYELCIGSIYRHVAVVFMIIDLFKFMVGYCSKILHKIFLSIGPIPLAASCFLSQEKWHPNPKTKSFPFVSLPTNHNSAVTIQYLFEFCFHFYNASDSCPAGVPWVWSSNGSNQQNL